MSEVDAVPKLLDKDATKSHCTNRMRIQKGGSMYWPTWRYLLIATLVTFWAFIAVAAPRAGTADATAYKQNVKHNGMAEIGPDPIFPLNRIWTLPVQGFISYPLIADGRVFITAYTGSETNVFAADPATGAVLWGPVSLAGCCEPGLPTYDSGVLFVVTSDVFNTQGIMTAIQPDTGAILWSAALPGQYDFTGPPIAADGMVYVGGAGVGGTLYALDETNGSLLWTRAVINGPISSPALEDGGPGLYVAYSCNVYGFNRATGATLWYNGTGCSGGGGVTLVYSSGNLYNADDGGVYDAATGVRISSFNANQLLPAIGETTGYFVWQGALDAIDLSTWTVLWHFTGTGSYINTSPLVINGKYVLITDYNGTLFAVDGQTGQVVWSDTIAPPPNNMFLNWSPAAAEGLILVPSDDTLIAYCATTCSGCGTITLSPAHLAAASVGAPYTQAIEAAGGASPYGYEVTAGSLPAGLHLSSEGTISGTPAASGLFSFTVTATDAVGCTGSQPYTLSVASLQTDLTLLDDYGRARLCISSISGNFVWTVLQGGGQGSYTGTSIVTRSNGLIMFSSPAGVSYRLSVRYYERYKKATGSYDNAPRRIRSVLFDSNTTNNAPGC
jgi:outer membrane protein assembly factor BamB